MESALVTLIDTFDSKKTHYPLGHAIGTVLPAANRAGLGVTAAIELAVRMTHQLGGAEEAANCARAFDAMAELAGALQKLKGLDG